MPGLCICQAQTVTILLDEELDFVQIGSVFDVLLIEGDLSVIEYVGLWKREEPVLSNKHLKLIQ